MSGRRLAAGAFGSLVRRGLAQNAVRHYHHHQRLPVGGLQRLDIASVRAARQRVGFPVNNYHNAVMVRNASFVRLIPKIVMKFARIPATFGGLMIGAAAWVQYQAIRTSAGGDKEQDRNGADTC